MPPSPKPPAPPPVKKATTPAKKSAPAPTTPAKKQAGGGGLNLPPNVTPNPTPGGPQVWDLPGFIGSYQNYPGFSPAQGATQKQYAYWLLNIAGGDPIFQQMVAKYGKKYQALAWQAYIGGWDSDTFMNALNRITGGAGLSGGGGGGGGYGGGGGVSKADQIAAAVAAVRNQASTIGLQMTDNEILWTATKAVNDSWSSDQLTDYLLSDVAKITAPGTYSQAQDQVKAMAKQQLVNISATTAAEWAKKILSGEMDIGTISSILAGQAKAEFGWAAEQIAGGATMADILAPTRDTIARELEVNPDTVDLMDPRWRAMTQTRDDKGVVRAATLTEAVQAARKDTAYAGTAGAAQRAASVATLLRRVFEGG